MDLLIRSQYWYLEKCGKSSYLEEPPEQTMNTYDGILKNKTQRDRAEMNIVLK